MRCAESKKLGKHLKPLSVLSTLTAVVLITSIMLFVSAALCLSHDLFLFQIVFVISKSFYSHFSGEEEIDDWYDSTKVSLEEKKS